MSKFREHPGESGWVTTYTPEALRIMGQQPALDESRVTSAMVPGWRYSELKPPSTEDFIGAIQTSSWFSIDAEALEGIMFGADPEFDQLPPLPFQRMTIDGWSEPENRYSSLLQFRLKPPDERHETGAGFRLLELQEKHNPQQYQYAVGMFLLFEIVQGQLWDVLVEITHLKNTFTTGNRFSHYGFHLTPGGHTADYESLRTLHKWDDASVEFDQSFGSAVWKAAVSSVHMIGATNVRNRRTLPNRKQVKEWQRRNYRPIEPKIYKVEIVNSVTTEPGYSDRHYTCRWMVRGHYRHTPHGSYKHPHDGLPASWIPAHVKGPAGAPWKGRGHYVKGA